MKNQYFGDKNDFFKYDFILTLTEEIRSLNSFVFIPMLTRNDTTNDGSLVNYQGNRRPILSNFLKKCVVNQKRNIKNLRVLMSSYYPGVLYIPYRDDQYFNHNRRLEYFYNIDKNILRNAVIFIDPDNGFEVSSMSNLNGHKYLKYSELLSLYDKMDNRSLLIVYQHIPRVQRQEYFSKVSENVRKHLDHACTICLSNNVIAFFIIYKACSIGDKVWDVVRKYSSENRYSVYRYLHKDVDSVNVGDGELMHNSIQTLDHIAICKEEKVSSQDNHSESEIEKAAIDIFPKINYKRGVDYDCDHFLVKFSLWAYRGIRGLIKR